MIISHRFKYLFVEVPRAASTAISRELRLNYAGEQILIKHSNYSEFRSVATREEKRYFAFAAVRNPLDAIVSDFVKYKTNKDQQYTDESAWARNRGWVPDDELERFRFVQDSDGEFSTYFRRYCGKGVYHQWTLLSSDRFDFVMRFERIADDFNKVLHLLGIEPVRALPVVNRSDRPRTYERFYTPDMRPLAVLKYGPFMKRWGYAFPQEWGPIRISMLRCLRFKILDESVNLASRFVPLSSQSEKMQRLKKLVNKFA